MFGHNGTYREHPQIKCPIVWLQRWKQPEWRCSVVGHLTHIVLIQFIQTCNCFPGKVFYDLLTKKPHNIMQSDVDWMVSWWSLLDLSHVLLHSPITVLAEEPGADMSSGGGHGGDMLIGSLLAPLLHLSRPSLTSLLSCLPLLCPTRFSGAGRKTEEPSLLHPVNITHTHLLPPHVMVFSLMLSLHCFRAPSLQIRH